MRITPVVFALLTCCFAVPGSAADGKPEMTWEAQDGEAIRVTRAQVSDFGFSESPVSWRVWIEFDSEAMARIQAFTEAHINTRVEIKVDGRVIAAPMIHEPIVGGSLEFRSLDPESVQALRDALEQPE